MGESLWLREVSQALQWTSPNGAAQVRGWSSSTDVLQLEAGATHFVFAHRGLANLSRGGVRFPISGGMFAAVPGVAQLAGAEPDSAGVVISHIGYLGMFQLGGPIEERGRLRYIDGCTDSLILAPPVLGDPCLNHLHIPAGTRQTEHDHPSIRIGLIVRGEGVCVTEAEELALRPGLAFMIAQDVAHSFRTNTSSLDVVVYHPESDTGPTHEDHPMLNRTIVR